MKNVKFYLRGHARSDIAQIRKYTIETWGEAQWLKYKEALFQKLQTLANNPLLGTSIEEVSEDAFRFPLKDHIVYYLKRKNDVVFVGVLPSHMSPKKHLQRKDDIANQLK
jgi:toxin ParE1/3/4